MRVNIYAEEMSNDIEIVEKEINGQKFTGLRFYLYLPVTVPVMDDKTGEDITVEQVQGKFMHHPNDDDSAAVTFWGKKDLRTTLLQALQVLDVHYKESIKSLDTEEEKFE